MGGWGDGGFGIEIGHRFIRICLPIVLGQDAPMYSIDPLPNIELWSLQEIATFVMLVMIICFAITTISLCLQNQVHQLHNIQGAIDYRRGEGNNIGAFDYTIAIVVLPT